MWRPCVTELLVEASLPVSDWDHSLPHRFCCCSHVPCVAANINTHVSECVLPVNIVYWDFFVAVIKCNVNSWID